MAEKRPGVLLAGAGLVWRRQGVLWWIYTVNLALAVFGTCGPILRNGEILDHSLAAARLVKGFDISTFAELSLQPEAPLGVSAPAMLLFGIVFFVFMLFATGGILEIFRRDEKLTASKFFGACGLFFWRFARLFIFLLVVLIPIAILAGFVNSWSKSINERSIRDMVGFWFEVGGGAFVLFLLMAVRLWFDMAEVHAVAENETRIRRSLIAAFRLTRKNFGSLFWLYLRISVVSWAGLILGLWVWVRIVKPESVGAAFLLSQLIVLFWLSTRLWQRSSETLWYQRRQPEPSSSASLTA